MCLSCSWLQHLLALPLQWGPAQEVVLKRVAFQGLAKCEGGSFLWPPWEQVKEREQKICEGEKDAVWIFILVVPAVETLGHTSAFAFPG